MVLSNKKLKQKLRAQLAESLVKSEQPNLNDESQTHQSFKSLLNSATLKPKLSKRDIRRVKTSQSIQPTPDLQSNGNGGGVEEKEGKKRKREKDVVGSKDDVDKGEDGVKELSKKKNKMKKKKKKKKGVKKEEEEGVQPVIEEEEEEEAVAEVIQTHNSSKEDESICTKIYVGGIPYYSTVDDIQSYFEGCGSITEIDCHKFPDTGKFNGIAMISFRTEAAAKRALALDGSDMGGLSLKIQPYKATREKKVSDFAPAMLEGYNRIYVGNLSWDTTEIELKKFFSDCSISSIRLGKDKETGEFKGYAHVDLSDSLSLTMALKLDQKPLFGRPVRIRCAVPPKSANPSSNSDPIVSKNDGNDTIINDDVARKAKWQTCYECGEKGHLSSSCPNKKTADVAHTGDKTDDVAFGTGMGKDEADNFGDGKLKRRTCYECGGKGHFSSSCPNKKAADVAHTGDKTDDVAFGMGMEKDEADNFGDGKLKRRRCYDCGEKGHLSSSCPNKQAADVAVVVADNERVDNTVINSVSDGKLRRRTCYECGDKGHLSSACPKKRAADVADSRNKANDMEVKKAEVAVVGDDVAISVSEGKLRRRTCYECGERGHLSSLCPNKQIADVANLSKKADDMAVEKVEEVKTVAVVGGGKLRRRTCYECGEKGHLSSLCPNKKDTGLTA